MSNENLETRPDLRAAIREVLDELREGLIASIRVAGEINVEIVSVPKSVSLALLRASGEVIASGIELGEELGGKAIRAIRGVGGAGLEATEATARSGRKAVHEIAETTLEMGSDVGAIARASVEGALDIGREAGSDGVRAATEVLSRVVNGATEIGKARRARPQSSEPAKEQKPAA